MDSGYVEASANPLPGPDRESALVTTDEDTGPVPFGRLRGWWPIVAGLLTVAMVAGLAYRLFGSGLSGLWRVVPESPLFYATFVLLYLSPAIFDFLIFRLLWGIPAEGFVALLKKRIANDALVGYSGDAYFYSWARQRSRIVSAPFGAVKDSSILSAIAGNLFTLATVVVALPIGWHLLSPDQRRGLLLSAVVILAFSLPWLVFSKQVFSLPRRSLWEVFGIHGLRLVVGSLLTAVAWHFAMPAVPLGAWLILSAVRLLVSRLPLVPNKDLLFANLAILMTGHNNAMGGMLAFMAALALVGHAVVMGVLGMGHVGSRLAKAPRGRGGA